jgi:hypothetical protein
MPREAAIAAIEPLSRALPQLVSASAVTARSGDFATALAQAARGLDPSERGQLMVRGLPAASASAPAAIETASAPATAEQPTNWRQLDARERSYRFAHGEVDPAGKQPSDLFGADGFGFDDLVDIINPLQHVPILSALYRWATGDKISQGASLAGDIMFGGALFAGPMAVIGPVMNAALTEATGGQNMSDRVATALLGPSPGEEVPTNLAETPPAMLARDEADVSPPVMASERPTEAAASAPPPPPADTSFVGQFGNGLDKYRAFALEKPKAFALPPPAGSPLAGAL